MHDQKTLDWFKRHGQTPPEHLNHGAADTYENPLSNKLKRVKTSNWRMEGNKLIADTDQGPLVQFIPPDYICKGTDERGLPILEKIVL